MPFRRRSEVSRTRSRDSGENDRTVARKLAWSGMTLSVVPAWKLPTVMTTGSNTSNVLVTSACRAVTISQAAGMGSAAACGREPCPPRPATVTRSVSAAAIIGPGRLVQREGCHRSLAGGVQHALLDHDLRAVVALLAGLEHEDHAPGQVGLASR